MRSVRPALTNPATWASVLVPLVMLASMSNNVQGLHAPATWEAVLATSGIGLTLGAPIVAAAAAWATGPIERWSSRNQLGSTRLVLSRVLLQVRPLLIAAAVGYGLCVALIAGATQPTWSEPRQLVVVATLAAMTLSAAIGGATLGLLMPTALATPIALIGGYAVVALPLVSTGLDSARLSFGYSLPFALQTVNERIDPTALAAPIIIAVGLVGILLIGELQTAWVRRLLRLLLVVVVVAAMPPFVATASSRIAIPRDSDTRHCSSTAPIVCLWPEFAPDAARLDTLAIDASSSLAAHGLPVPDRIVSDNSLRAGGADMVWSIEPGDRLTSQLVEFAAGYQRIEACPKTAKDPTENANEEQALVALAIALGADAEDLAQSGWIILDGVNSGSALLTALGMDQPEDGFALYKNWSAANSRICT